MQKEIINYLSNHCGLFTENFRKVTESFDADAIHDMRVAFKRIRAVYLLAEHIDHKAFSARVNEGKLRLLFRYSGRMRDAQVQQELIARLAEENHTTCHEYMSHLEKLEKKAIRKFRTFISTIDAGTELAAGAEKAGQLFQQSGPETIRTHLITIVDELFEKATQLRSTGNSDETLHEIRRRLKQCHYLLSTFSTDDPELPRLKTTLKRLDKVNEMLGDWHDHVVAVEYLSKFITGHRDPGEAGFSRFEMLQAHTMAKRDELRVRILAYAGTKLGI